MPRAEIGSTKHISNKLKSKGLQRLRWYCQACERQMRDENGFKCHVQSESHVRQMLVLGENPNRAINDYSKQFEHDFVQQLRTSHNTKPVLINRFYQNYIANKEHVHMNATKWKSLTEFAKYLGQQGVARVQETDKGIEVAWIDNSPDALRRQDAIRKKERMDKGDEEREQRLIQEQVERAQEKGTMDSEPNDEARTLQRTEGERISMSFGPKPTPNRLLTPPHTSDGEVATREFVESKAAAAAVVAGAAEEEEKKEESDNDDEQETDTFTVTPPEEGSSALEVTSGIVDSAPTKPAPALKMSFGANPSKPKNVFSVKANPLSGKKGPVVEQPKKISEAERIMKEEIERKRARESTSGIHFGVKKQKVT